MGCGGSKATRIKNAPEAVHLPSATEQAVNSSSENREEPGGKKTEQLTDDTQNQTDDKPHTTEDEGPLTKEQMLLVQDTWRSVKGAFDLQQVGVEFYVRLFTDSPELLQLFSFRDMADLSEDDMRNDQRLKKQALATIQHVDLAVNSLNDLDSIVPALKDLGARHTMYSVKEHHFGPVGAALLNTLGMGLGDKFTSEVKEAWTLVYGIVANTMKEGMKELIDAQ